LHRGLLAGARPCICVPAASARTAARTGLHARAC